MLSIAYPNTTDRASIGHLIDTVTMLVLTNPRACVLSTVTPLHHPEAVHLVGMKLPKKLFVRSGPVEFSEPFDDTVAPVTCVGCSVCPLHRT